MSTVLHICHVTTVHPSKDVRIFHKECRSLAKAGHRVTLLVGNGITESIDGVEIKAVEVDYTGRLSRFLKLGKSIYKAALNENADIYHFHDPEFLRFAKKLKVKGFKVVYDVHEDLPRQLLNKHYLPKVISSMLSKILERYENKIAKCLDAIVTATDHITERFSSINPNSTSIKNYPILDDILSPSPFSEKENFACYVGSLTRVRGIVELVKAMEGTSFRLQLAGKFSPVELEEQMKSTKGWQNVDFYGWADRRMVQDILKKSMVGMVTLHPIINYMDALPVKMFEYMAAGIPVVTSDIPLWKEIVETAGCGIAVDPYNPEAIKEAITSLTNDRTSAEQMGLNGRKAVEEKFNWANEERKLLEIYYNLSKNE